MKGPNRDERYVGSWLLGDGSIAGFRLRLILRFVVLCGDVGDLLCGDVGDLFA